MTEAGLYAILGVLWGAAFGSFSCVVIERGWRHVNGRSECVCGRPLSWWENIPILAWPLLRGKSRCCKARIPAWYWYVEILSATFWGLMGYALGIPGLVLATVITLLMASGVSFLKKGAR